MVMMATGLCGFASAVHRRRHRRRSSVTAAEGDKHSHFRTFHATRRREILPFIGVAVVVGAVAARYIVRAWRRAKLEEEGGETPDDSEGQQRPQGHTVGRSFPVCGLDVGSLTSVVAVATSRSSTPSIVENHEGSRTTPTYLAYEDGHTVVGMLARRGRWRDPTRVAFNPQRFLGLPYSDKLRPLYPFRLAEAEQGRPQSGFRLEIGGGPPLTAVDATARVVENLVASAEHKLHTPPGLVVMTVPSHFSEAQKSAALEAAEEGTGLPQGSIEVLDDAVAALVAAKYTGVIDVPAGQEFDRPWLCVDVGGLTSQISVVSLSHDTGLAVQVHELVETVGGDQLDNVLVRYMVDYFKEKNRGLDLGQDYLALERLYAAAESAKVELSIKVSASISLPFISADHTGPKHFDLRLSRAQYQALVEPVLSQLREPFQRVLERAGLETSQLHGVLLTGGTSRLPFLKELVASLAKRQPLCLENPEESAALGAAYFGREVC